MTKRPSLSKLKKKADLIYSRRLRQKYADKNGMCKCYTCNTIKPWQEMQCGHFVSRTYTSLRFDHRNTKPQCVGCNMFNHGRLDVYATKLVKEYGQGILEELQKDKKKQLTSREVKELVESVINME